MFLNWRIINFHSCTFPYLNYFLTCFEFERKKSEQYIHFGNSSKEASVKNICVFAGKLQESKLWSMPELPMTWESDILEVVVGLNPTISGKVILNKANCNIQASVVWTCKIAYRPELQIKTVGIYPIKVPGCYSCWTEQILG